MNSLTSLRDLSGMALPSLEDIQAERRRRATSVDARETIEESCARCESFAGFLRESWHVLNPETPFEPNWHVNLVCDHLEAISRGYLIECGLENRIMFNLPPGTMKSYTISVAWNAYEWGPLGKPWTQWLTATYREDYALRDSRKTRDLIMSEWYQERWGAGVRLTTSGEKRFENTARGFRQAVPFGSLTAGRGDRVVIDDPHSVDTAESEADRNLITRRFRESVPSRVNDPRTSAIVVMMHRLHPKDVCGVIEEQKLPYTRIALPMEFDPEIACSTPVGRDPRTEPGQLLFPARWDENVIARMKTEMTDYAWSAQMNQRATGRTGDMFPRSDIVYVDAAPADAIRCRGWDFAGTKKKPGTSPSASVGALLSRDRKGIFYVEEVERGFWSGDEVDRKFKNLSFSDMNRFPGCRVRIPQDPGAAGKSRAEYLASTVAGCNVVVEPVSGSKEIRAESFSAQWRAGNVRIVKGPWNDAYVDEVCPFPNGVKDDQVDASADAFNELALGSSYTLANVR